MLSIPPTGQAPDTPLARWQEQYRTQVRIAADGGDFVRQQRGVLEPAEQHCRLPQAGP